jgi:hypothetical protein
VGLAVIEGLYAQRDFSGGQPNARDRRQDEKPTFKTGARQLSNWKIEAQNTISQRPGRRAFVGTSASRVEYFQPSPTDEFFINFEPGAIVIRDMTGLLVVKNTSPAYLWTHATRDQISWCQSSFDLVICFPGMRPQIVRWVPIQKVFQFLPFTFSTLNYAVQEPFYRFSAPGARLTCSSDTGAITVTCTDEAGNLVNYFTPAMVGRIISYIGQQITITGVVNGSTANATVSNRLPKQISITVADGTPFSVGQICGFLKASASQIEVASVGTIGGVTTVLGTMITDLNIPAGEPISGEALISPIGSSTVSAVSAYSSSRVSSALWLEEFMSDLNGWPQACYFSNNRLCFCDFPQMPEAIVWSAVGVFDDFWVDSVAVQTSQSAGASPSSAMLEFISTNKPRVRNLTQAFGDLFVFTDRGIYEIPVSPSQPLKPGGVEFRKFSSDGASGIAPIPTNDCIVYVNAALNRVCVVRATGSYTRPYVTEDMTDDYSDLFTSPICLKVAQGDTAHPERYVYVVNSDGSLVVGKFAQDRSLIGWVPWNTPNALCTWIDAVRLNVWYSMEYGNGYFILETEDQSVYLDAAVYLNNPPEWLVPAGLGPQDWLRGMNVVLMDGTRDLGDFQIGTDGVLVPQTGVDTSSATVMVGLPILPVLEPFIPNAPSGQSEHQRQRRRRIARAAVLVDQTIGGFMFGNREIPVYDYGEDNSAAPVAKSRMYRIRPPGRSFDLRAPVLQKTRPGPIRVVEISLEGTY